MTDNPTTLKPFDLSGENPWRTNGTALVYENKYLRLREDAVLGPDGRPGTYTYIEFPAPIIGIVPVANDGQVYLVRQWRYPWARNSWEIPVGSSRPGEDILVAAQRELAEEAGVIAASWKPLGSVYASSIFDQSYQLYLAQGLSASANAPRSGTEQDLEPCRIPLSTAVQAALDGVIVHGVTIVALLRAAASLKLTNFVI